MQITIEFYGRLKALFAQNQVQFETTEQTIEDIYLALCQAHQVEPTQAVIKPILNDEFSDWQTQVTAADVLGFFPPAAGG